jgi:hypothetical protein
MKRISALILAIIFAILSFAGILAGCSENSGSDAQQTDTQSQNGEVTGEPDILDGLDFNGSVINIQMSATDISSDDLMIGSGEQTGDVVNDAVYDRNMAVEEGLNVVMNYIETNYNWSDVAGEAEKLVMAGDSTYHFIVNDQLGLSTASVNHYLVNAYDAAYFDFDSDGWWVDYMKDLSLSNDKLYLLVGDYFIDVLNHSHVLLYNRRIFTDLYQDADMIYKQVADGKWIYDTFNAYITEAYQDINGDGAKDADDIYGMIIGGIGGSTFPFTYGSDAQFVTRDENGTPTLTMNNERTLLLYDKIYAAFYNEGTRTTYGENGPDLHSKFMSGGALFISGTGFGDFEIFRQMDDDIGLIPYPKLDETQKTYNTVIHDTAEVGAILITCPDVDMTSAVIQSLCKETYRTVLPAYYETALKIKYVRDNYTSQMIDLVHDGINGLFSLVYGASYANNIFTWTFLEPLQAKNKSITSAYEKREEAAVSQLSALVEAWNNG